MHPKNLSITDFTYSLPENRIANYPLAERDASKLLIYKNGNITEDIYKNIAEHIPANSLLVFNNTKVVEARLFFKNQPVVLLKYFAWNRMNNMPISPLRCCNREKYFGNVWLAALPNGNMGKYWKRRSFLLMTKK